ncbi:TMTC3-like protein [Mya arenaria]|uniref:dolichyl-phosphate-mannose--protein mannosyltransferase n=1 Tax=Mya arenaria TaxID=6604 RepID=A0ABY7EKL1_MYAAR|nr:TMTC3-like protein [Mya arenaria]
MGTEESRFTLYSIILCVTVGVCYIRAMDCGFCFDDMSAIVENKDLRPHTPVSNLFLNDFWGTPMYKEKSHKSYRPLCVLTFRFNYMLSELEPMTYHLLNVILHAVVCVMYMRVCTMFLSEFPSFVAALLFAVHPIHTEAVTGVVGRAEALSSIFFLAAMMTYPKSMLCKEQGITVIGVCVVYELFVAQRGKPALPPWLWGSITRSAILVGSTVFLLVARIKVMGAQLPIFTKFDNPASVSPTPARQLTYNYLLPVNFWLLLFPADLCCDWTMGTISVIQSIADWRNLITLLFWVCLGKVIQIALSRQGKFNRALLISIALMAMPFVPASNLFFPVGFVVAERILYTPSMGFCMLVALGLDVIMQNKQLPKVLLMFLTGSLLVSHGLKTYMRNIDWTSEYTIFRAALRVNTQNAKLWNNTLKRFDEAEQAFLKALELFPPVISARVAPSHLNVYLNLASLYSRDPSRLLEADGLLKTATDMRPDYQSLYNSAVMIQEERLTDRWPVAVERFKQLIKKQSNDSRPPFSLAMLMMDMGDFNAAEKYFKLAIKIEPTFKSALFNLALMLTNNLQRPMDAVPFVRELLKCFNKVIEVEPENIEALHNLCVVLVERGDLIQAEKCLTHVHNKAPQEQYIARHLNIVRAKLNEAIKKRQEELAAQKAAEGQGSNAQQQGSNAHGQNEAAQDQGAPNQGQDTAVHGQGQRSSGQQNGGQGQQNVGQGHESQRRDNVQGAKVGG